MSRHAWDKSYKKLVEISKGKNYELIMLEIGRFERVGNKAQQFSHWWEKIK